MKYTCPNCAKTIFNRRLLHCEFCHFALPQKLLLSHAEKQKLDKQYTANQLGISRQRLSKDVGYSGVTESNEVSFLLGELTLRARAPRKCIKCGLTVSEEFEDCPYCFGQNESQISKAKARHQHEMKLVRNLGKYFTLVFIIILAVLLGVFVI